MNLRTIVIGRWDITEITDGETGARRVFKAGETYDVDEETLVRLQSHDIVVVGAPKRV